MSFLDPGHLPYTSKMRQGQYCSALSVLPMSCTPVVQSSLRSWSAQFTTPALATLPGCNVRSPLTFTFVFPLETKRSGALRHKRVQCIVFRKHSVSPRVATISHPAASDHLATTTWRNKTCTGVLRLFASLGAHSRVTRLHCPAAAQTLTPQSTTCTLATTSCLQWTSALAVHEHRKISSHLTKLSLR